MRRLLFLVTTMFLMVQGASAWNGSGSSGDPYLIASPADWETFATSTNAYSETFFKLTADITVTTMRTKTFSGTFDGGGNTLTFNYTATGDNAAPFAYITGATIKNLRVAGTINTGYKFAAGIVAISNGGSIENCQSSVTIDSSTSGDGTHGGLVADSYTGTLDISNCLFDGKLLGKNTTSCGGIVGWHKQGTLNISNTLFAPAEVTVQGGAIFARNGATSLTNCYYISDWSAATDQGTNANSMTAEALVAALNNGTKNWCVYRGNAIPIMVNLVISTKAQWDTFAANVGNYDGKYVQLSANIGTAKIPVTAMKSGEFKGVFDGNGYTLTVNLTNSGGNVAPFYYLYGGTIMNLTVSGGVTTAGSFNAGLVARTHGGINYIQNCIIHTNVAVKDYGGGVVGHADNASSLTISDCIYDGTITHTGDYAGGFIGWYNNNQTLDLVMTNCLFKGDYTGNGQFHPIGVKKLDGIFKSINCTNCYYTKNPANIADTRRTFTDGTKVCELSLGDNIIATGSSCTFDGKTYHLGTVSLSYTPSKSTLFYMIDGNEISGNSFTISKDNQAFDAGAVTITAGDTSITYHYGGTNNTILYIDVNNGNSNMVTHPWTSGANYSSITSVVIGDGVTSICGNAFKQCPNLTSASIASTVTSIDNQAFSECGKLETVTFTDADNSHLTIIRPNAFANCEKLSSITIPEGVGEIGEFAFVCCSALVSATLPSTLSTMGVHVFRDCTSLASVFCLASTPPTGGSNMFNSNASGRKIYVPAGSVGDYKTAAYWSSYASDIIGIQFLTLNESTSNSTAIQNANGQMSEVTLSGRTLYKDGKWNTLCLPFNFSAEQIAAHKDFAGAKLMELNTNGKNGFDATNGTLYLAFKEATAITAGVPYLVKWDAAGADFTSPVFFGVTINATATTTVSNADTGLAEVQMVGCYSPVSVDANDKSILFLGDNNTLYYSTENRNIRSCRAYFSVPYLKQNPGAKTRAFVLNFDDEEATGILEISADSKEKKDDAWYSLAGVRLSGKPAQRGIYINNGNKVVIK
ncbi:leucine-rich repeat domain-containing protein [Xylanibacter brevis]|uniref:leucine-rich repeat domain-containing protein n=1 Tax=Xylanibacter brevis TaxID=83231 RepID=UPI00138E27AE|nr:leucine-rich repeat domain-containing protein [Xylanibacter brevis]